MRWRPHSFWALSCVCALGGVLGAIGQPTARGQDPSGSTATTASPEERAGDDAFQQLIDKVLALRLADGKTQVATLLALSDTGTPVPGAPRGAGIPERELRRLLLSQRQLSAARQLSGGGVEIDAWLPATRLTEVLQQAAAKIPKINMARIALHASTGPTITATGRFVPDGRPRDDRPGWRQCAPNQIQQVRAAVELDLAAHVLALIAELRTADEKPMREFINRHPGFRTALLARIKAIRMSAPVYEPTGVCRVAISTSRKEIAELIRGAAKESGEAIPAGIEQAADTIAADAVIIEGLAVPPPLKMVVTPAAAPPAADPDRPQWAERFVSIKAKGNPPPGITDVRARRDLAARAARLEAARLLWLEIEKLPLPSGTVGDRLARDPRVASAEAAIDALILPMSDPVYAEDDSATTTLGIRLEAVWGLIRDLH